MKISVVMGIILLLTVQSCSVSNDVASNRLIQKRKYNKGFFVSKKISSIKLNEDNADDVVLNETISDEIILNHETENRYLKLDESITDNDIIESVNYPNNSVNSGYDEFPSSSENEIENDELSDQNKIQLIEGNHNQEEFIDDEEPAVEDEVKDRTLSQMIIGSILLYFGLAPFGILLIKGKGKDFNVVLVLWILTLCCSIAAFIVFTVWGTSGPLVFVYVGLILLQMGFTIWLYIKSTIVAIMAWIAYFKRAK